MKTERNAFTRSTNRRAFFRNGAAAAGAATSGGRLLKGAALAFGRDLEDSGPPITSGDIAILQFLSAAEQNRGLSVDTVLRTRGNRGQ